LTITYTCRYCHNSYESTTGRERTVCDARECNTRRDREVQRAYRRRKSLEEVGAKNFQKQLLLATHGEPQPFTLVNVSLLNEMRREIEHLKWQLAEADVTITLLCEKIERDAQRNAS
jgi:hypothetical protein